MTWKISFLDRNTLGDNLELRKPNFDHVWCEYLYTEPGKQVVERLKDSDIVIINKVNLSKEILEQLPKLKLIAIAATGYNVVDIDYARQKGIVVSNARGYAFDSVPEHTFALILSLRKKLSWFHQEVQRGRWQQEKRFCFFDDPILSLAGTRLGIIGSGSIGLAVAKLGRAFGMEVVFALRSSETKVNKHKEDFAFVPLDEIIQTSQVISIHCPLNKETKDLISLKELKQMRSDCILVNTARGGIVNESDLAQAIKENLIAAAAVDVLSQEPPELEHPYYSIMNRPNFILTPHVAWISTSSLERLWSQVLENIVNFVGGEPTRVIV